MVCKRRVLRAIAAAALAMSAIAVSTATAQETSVRFTSDGPVTWRASQTGEKSGNAITVPGFPPATLECSEKLYTGGKAIATPHSLLPVNASEITVIWSNTKDCLMNSVFKTFPTSTLMNGCDYRIRDVTTTGGVIGTYGIATDLNCPTGNSITIRAYTDATKQAENKPFCIFHLPPQNSLEGVHLTDAGNGHLNLAGTFENIVVNTTKVEESAYCPSSTTKAKQDIDLTIEGRNSLTEGTAISLSH